MDKRKSQLQTPRDQIIRHDSNHHSLTRPVPTVITLRDGTLHRLRKREPVTVHTVDEQPQVILRVSPLARKSGRSIEPQSGIEASRSKPLSRRYTKKLSRRGKFVSKDDTPEKIQALSCPTQLTKNMKRIRSQGGLNKNACKLAILRSTLHMTNEE